MGNALKIGHSENRRPELGSIFEIALLHPCSL